MIEVDWNAMLWDKIAEETKLMFYGVNFTNKQHFIDHAEKIGRAMEVVRYFDEHEFPNFFAEKLCCIDNLIDKVTDQLIKIIDGQCFIPEAIEVMINEMEAPIDSENI